MWGDTVNMASRLDSTGVKGKIHISEATSKILEEQDFTIEFRGLTFVKGKGEVFTYFVDPFSEPDNQPIIEYPRQVLPRSSSVSSVPSHLGPRRISFLSEDTDNLYAELEDVKDIARGLTKKQSVAPTLSNIEEGSENESDTSEEWEKIVTVAQPLDPSLLNPSWSSRPSVSSTRGSFSSSRRSSFSIPDDFTTNSISGSISGESAISLGIGTPCDEDTYL